MNGLPAGAGRSEVAALIARIDAEYSAACCGLYDVAEGTARHDFISAKMERIDEARQALSAQIGEEAAMELVIVTLAGKSS